MSASGRHALPELWTELNVARTQKERCAKEIDAIKISCRADHGKDLVSECPECYSKVIDVLQTRYCGNEGREWFTTRKAFVHELRELFADCKDGKLDLKVIEDRIESEKEAWYRWVLRMHPEFLTVANSGVDQEELRAMLDDPDKSREQLIEKVWEGVGKPADWENTLDSFVKEFEAVKGDPVELKKLYISQLFTDGDGKMLENGQKYIDGLQDMNGEVLMEIIDKIAHDEKANKSSQPQRDSRTRRLDELRRAKAAFEQNRAQAKARRLEAQSRAIPEELYHLPPCSVCGSAVDPKKVTSCTTCQAMMNMGGPYTLTIYCSVDCMHRGYVCLTLNSSLIMSLKLIYLPRMSIQRYTCVAKERGVPEMKTRTWMEDGTRLSSATNASKKGRPIFGAPSNAPT